VAAWQSQDATKLPRRVTVQAGLAIQPVNISIFCFQIVWPRQRILSKLETTACRQTVDRRNCRIPPTFHLRWSYFASLGIFILSDFHAFELVIIMMKHPSNLGSTCVEFGLAPIHCTGLSGLRKVMDILMRYGCKVHTRITDECMSSRDGKCITAIELAQSVVQCTVVLASSDKECCWANNSV
jgi:hypothetical protein